MTLATGLVAYAAFSGLHKAVERGFRVNEETRNRFPRIEERVNRYRGIIETAVRSTVVLVAALVVLDAWGLGPFDWLASEGGRVLVGRLVTVVFVAGGALVAWELLSALVERHLEERDAQGELVERGARVRTFLPLVRNVVRIVLLVLVVLVVLSEIGIDIGPLLAGAGIVGLAVSFGAQSLVKDVITGFFILLEDTISVGDVVDLGGRTGIVESMTIRSVRLRGPGRQRPYRAVRRGGGRPQHDQGLLLRADGGGHRLPRGRRRGGRGAARDRRRNAGGRGFRSGSSWSRCRCSGSIPSVRRRSTSGSGSRRCPSSSGRSGASTSGA